MRYLRMRMDQTMLSNLRGRRLTGLTLSAVFRRKYAFKSVATGGVPAVVLKGPLRW